MEPTNITSGDIKKIVVTSLVASTVGAIGFFAVKGLVDLAGGVAQGVRTKMKEKQAQKEEAASK